MMVTWELIVFDVQGEPCSTEFEISAGTTPIIIGLHSGKFAMQNNIARSPYLQFHCPSDKFQRLLNTYVAVEDHEPLCKRIRLSNLPKPQECITSLVSTALATRAGEQTKSIC